MARYGISAPKVFGVSMDTMQSLARQLGKDHELAQKLWDTGWYEARILAAFADEPALVTTSQMDRWAKEFDNWAVCDTLCFKLFDRSPHAWKMIPRWAMRRDEFVRRAAFALLASLALHDKESSDSRFLALMPLIEQASDDERNFVKKGVSWALRAIGKRSPKLNRAALRMATRLAKSSVPAARWTGKDVLRDISRRFDGRGRKVTSRGAERTTRRKDR